MSGCTDAGSESQEVKWLDQGHSAKQWQGWDLCAGLLTQGFFHPKSPKVVHSIGPCGLGSSAQKEGTGGLLVKKLQADLVSNPTLFLAV